MVYLKFEEFARRNISIILSGERICVLSTWLKREEKRNIILRMGENVKKLTLCC